MTLKRLSIRSYVNTTAVNPGERGGMSGRKSGLFTLDHFCGEKNTTNINKSVGNSIQCTRFLIFTINASTFHDFFNDLKCSKIISSLSQNMALFGNTHGL